MNVSAGYRHSACVCEVCKHKYLLFMFSTSGRSIRISMVERNVFLFRPRTLIVDHFRTGLCGPGEKGTTGGWVTETQSAGTVPNQLLILLTLVR